MNKVILCEGETDAILLSYYLEKISGWKYSKNPENLRIKKQNNNESINWYKKNNDYLLICAVGGKNNFGSFFESRLKAHLGVTWAVQYPEKIFSRIDEQIKNVHWEDYESLNKCFLILKDL